MTTAAPKTSKPASSGTGLQTAQKLFSDSLTRFSAVWLLAIFITIFSIVKPHLYPTKTTLQIVLSSRVTFGLLAIALLVPLAAGAFDLTVGAMLGLGLALTVQFHVSHGWNPIVAGIAAIVICGAVGWVNGFLIVRLHIDSFIATLGMSQLLSAASLRLSKNKTVNANFDQWFRNLTLNDLFGIKLTVFYLLAIAIVVWYVLEYTPVGRSLFATGGNPEAARLAGVPTGRRIWGAMITSGVIAGFAGVLLASATDQSTGTEGPIYLFPAFAAVFFGATQIKGRGNVWGTLLALYSLGAGVNGLQLTFFENQYWFDPLFNGSALLIAVAVASRQVGNRRRWTRGSKKSKAAPPAIPAATSSV